MSRELRYLNRWTIGQWQFFEIDGGQISESYEGRPLFGFADSAVDVGAEKVREWFNTLERVMVAAIAEKYTGPRGAGGTGVGTAADWFMRMIGADQLHEAGPDGNRALAQVIEAGVDGFPSVGPVGIAGRIEKGLEKRGYVIARLPID